MRSTPSACSTAFTSLTLPGATIPTFTLVSASRLSPLSFVEITVYLCVPSVSPVSAVSVKDNFLPGSGFWNTFTTLSPSRFIVILSMLSRVFPSAVCAGAVNDSSTSSLPSAPATAARSAIGAGTCIVPPSVTVKESTYSRYESEGLMSCIPKL